MKYNPNDPDVRGFIEVIEDLSKTLHQEGIFIGEKGAIDVEKLHSLYQSITDEAIRDSPDKVACKMGCFYCCYLTVDVMPGEMSYILDRYKQQYGDERYKELCERSEERYAHTKGLNTEERQKLRKPCPFLQGTLCTIYDYRPISCRSMNVVHDNNSCVEAFHGNDDGSTGFLAKPKMFLAMISIVLYGKRKGMSLEKAFLETMENNDEGWVSMEESINLCINQS